MMAIEGAIAMVLRSMSEHIREGGTPFIEGSHSLMDSDYLTTFIGQLLYRAGAKIQIRVVGASPNDVPDPGEFHHCFIEVYYPPARKWLRLDPWQSTKTWAKSEVWPIESNDTKEA